MLTRLWNERHQSDDDWQYDDRWRFSRDFNRAVRQNLMPSFWDTLALTLRRH